MDRRQAWLLIEGFIAAPFAAALAWICISAVAGTGSSDPTALFTAVVLLYLFSAPVIVAVGVPALALAHRLRRVRWWVATITGMASGVLYPVICNSGEVDAAWFRDHCRELFQFGLSGLAPALLVWWYWQQAYARETTSP